MDHELLPNNAAESSSTVAGITYWWRWHVHDAKYKQQYVHLVNNYNPSTVLPSCQVVYVPWFIYLWKWGTTFIYPAGIVFRFWLVVRHHIYNFSNQKHALIVQNLSHCLQNLCWTSVVHIYFVFQFVRNKYHLFPSNKVKINPGVI